MKPVSGEKGTAEMNSPYSFSFTSEMGSEKMEQKEMAEAAEWLREWPMWCGTFLSFFRASSACSCSRADTMSL